MIPLGVLASSHVASAVGLTPTLTHMAGLTGGAPYTFNSVNLGAAASDRTVVVVFGSRGISAAAAVTIGGIAAAIDYDYAHQEAPGNYQRVGFARLNVPSGTSTTVVVTGLSNRCLIGVYTFPVLINPTGTSGAGNSAPGGASAVSTSITVPAGGAALAGIAAGGDFEPTWSGATADGSHFTQIRLAVAHTPASGTVGATFAIDNDLALGVIAYEPA